MKYRVISAVFSMLIFSLAAWADSEGCSIGTGKISGVKSIVLQNRILKTEILPEATGRLASIYYKPAKVELLVPYQQETKFVDVLVPPRVSSNRAGYKEWFYGVQNGYITDMTAKVLTDSSEEASISLFDKFYQNINFSLERTVTLKRDSSELDIGVKIKNIGEKRQKLALWLNLIPAINDSSRLLIPAAGNKKLIMGRSVYSCGFDQLLEIKDTTLNSFFVAPSRPWFAIAMPNKKVILAYKVKKRYIIPQGLLYTWKGYVKGKKRKTLEMILSPRYLQPGESAGFQFKIIVFSGLSSLNSIAGNIGIQSKPDIKNNRVKLSLTSCRIEAPQKLTIDFGGKKGKSVHDIPKLCPGEPFSIIVKVPESLRGGKNLIVNGKFSGGNSFRLLP